jgi:hypothetical protein
VFQPGGNFTTKEALQRASSLELEISKTLTEHQSTVVEQVSLSGVSSCRCSEDGQRIYFERQQSGCTKINSTGSSAEP